MGFSKNQFCKHVEWEDKSSDSIGLRFISNGDKEISKNSKVFVEDNQLALFYLEGQITDVFWPGTHKLSDSNNVAMTSEMLGWRHPFDTPYEGDVYFFNTDSFSKQKWVTHSAVTVNDNENGVVKIKCFGTFSYNVINPGNLIAKAFGAKPLLKTSDLEASLNDIITKNIPAIFSESKISVKAAISDSSALSESALSVLQNDFSELGLEVRAFVFDNISNEDEKPTLAAYEESIQISKFNIPINRFNSRNRNSLSLQERNRFRRNRDRQISRLSIIIRILILLVPRWAEPAVADLL